jgi:hypothetical protein
MKLFERITTALILKFENYIHTIIIKNKNENVYMCDRFDCRNNHKNHKYKIPIDEPQCPIFNDNRCCGGCGLSTTCEHIVNCSCYGFGYALMGGTQKRYYLTKASRFHGGRIGKDGKFDWIHWDKIKSKKNYGG